MIYAVKELPIFFTNVFCQLSLVSRWSFDFGKRIVRFAWERTWTSKHYTVQNRNSCIGCNLKNTKQSRSCKDVFTAISEESLTRINSALPAAVGMNVNHHKALIATSWRTWQLIKIVRDKRNANFYKKVAHLIFINIKLLLNLKKISILGN